VKFFWFRYFDLVSFQLHCCSC